jgi:hypothetical protein
MKLAARVAMLLFLSFGASSIAPAASGWFEAGDLALRSDLQLLNDAEVIRLPISHWPLPRAAVESAIANARDHFAQNSAVRVALARVRARVQQRGDSPLRFEARASAGNAALVRDFDTIGREDAELGAQASLDGERFSAQARLTGALDQSHDQSLRIDGSHLTGQLGNWLVSAHTLDRWWGPAHESSLILSSNARPMPTLMVERAVPRPFETPWLSWLGPWRFSFGISQMESERQDIDSPLFMAWRVTIMPFKDIELGFSRTAQFCGDQLECDLNTFGNMLAGNDNVGIDSTPESEPGNQMAGFDIRWGSPIGSWPYAVYAQLIGEDESSYLPVKFLAQYGLEVWKPLSRGGVVQMFAEYADTTCSANRANPRFGCAYNQGRFNVEGYRYRGRVIGHTTDRDAESYAVGATYVAPDGTSWTATARSSDLNRGIVDVRNTVSSVPAEYQGIEIGWKGKLFDESVSVEVGVEALEPLGAGRTTEAFGFVGWHHSFGD